MELLQLIFSVIAGLGAGAMGALIVARRAQDADWEHRIDERIGDLEHRSKTISDQLDHFAERVASADRDIRQRLHAGLVARDERINAIGDGVMRLERSLEGLVTHDERINAIGDDMKRLERSLEASTNAAPPARVRTRSKDPTEGRLGTIESTVGQLDRRIQAKLIAFREGTQQALRKLAEHQVDEATRITALTQAEAENRRRIDVLEGLEMGRANLTAVQDRLDALQASLDETRVAAASNPPSQPPTLASSQRRAGAPAAPTDALEQIFGIGPKLAERLHSHGVADIVALARLSEDDRRRLGRELKGFEERQRRHDWIGQARRLLESRERPAAAPTSDPSVLDPKRQSRPAGARAAPEAHAPPGPPPAWPVPTAPPDPEPIH